MGEGLGIQRKKESLVSGQQAAKERKGWTQVERSYRTVRGGGGIVNNVGNPPPTICVTRKKNNLEM